MTTCKTYLHHLGDDLVLQVPLFFDSDTLSLVEFAYPVEGLTRALEESQRRLFEMVDSQGFELRLRRPRAPRQFVAKFLYTIH